MHSSIVSGTRVVHLHRSAISTKNLHGFFALEVASLSPHITIELYIVLESNVLSYTMITTEVVLVLQSGVYPSWSCVNVELNDMR